MRSKHPVWNIARMAALPIVVIALACPCRASGLTFTGSAATQSGPQTHHPFILREFAGNVGYMLGEPDFYAVVGGLSALPEVFKSAFDHETPEFHQSFGQSQLADNVFEGGEIIGSAIFPVAGAAAIWVVGEKAHSEKLRDFGSDLLCAQFINGVATLGMKAAINRTRPNGGSYSYPSGHTSSAFTTAGVVYEEFGPHWGIPAFLLASYVGVSRVQEDKHYVSDVVAGAILGSYVGIKVTRHGRNTRAVSVAPMVSQRATGLAISLRF